MISFRVHTEKETSALAKALRPLLKRGDIVALFGTLGVGKTAFVRALIQAVYPKEEVPSPTFTLVQTYDLEENQLFHFDLYRLEDPEEVYELGVEEAFSDGISFIEWPEKMGKLLPSSKILKVEIASDGSDRIFTFSSQNPLWQERLKTLIGFKPSAYLPMITRE